MINDRQMKKKKALLHIIDLTIGPLEKKKIPD